MTGEGHPGGGRPRHAHDNTNTTDTAMELAVETAWLNEDGDPDTVRVLVPADLV